MSIANPISKIGDVIRGSIIAERPEHISPLLQSVIEQVKKQGGKLYVKNFWADPKPLSLGYVGVHIKIRMPIPSENSDERKAILMELQLHLKAIIDGTEDCAKKISQHLYKAPQDGSEETISPEIISSSQLIYLTAMTKLLAPQISLDRVDNTVQLFQNKNLWLGDWNEQYQVVVPKDGDAVAEAWMDTAKKINAMLNLPTIEMDASDEWTNTATSIEEIYADADKIAPFFHTMCQRAAASVAGCTFNFGPHNAYMKKAKNSLLDKIKKDYDAALKPLLTQLMQKIRRTWTQITESDSVPFRDFSEVKNLNFSGCSQITDSDLAFLKYFSSLERLNLVRCSGLTDEGLAHLEGLPKLGYLHLSGGRFTGKGLYYLWCLPALHSLTRFGCPEITDVGLAGARLQRLNPSPQNPHSSEASQTVSSNTQPPKDDYLKLLLQLLENPSVRSDASLVEILEQEANELMNQEEENLSPKQVKGYRLLQNLLVGEKVSSIVAKNFRNLHASEEKKSPPVTLHMPTFSPQASSATPTVFYPRTSSAFEVKDPQKTSFQEEGKKPPVASHTSIPRPQTQTSVNLEWITPEQRAKFRISQKTNLATLQKVILDLTSFQITESDWTLLGSLPELRDLRLENCTDDDLAHLGRLSVLQSLTLHNCEQITDSGLSHLERLSALQSLDLSFCKLITDSGLSHLGRLSALKSLGLSCCEQITNSGLSNLGRLSALQNLKLDVCWKITDSGWAHVAQLSALQSLDLSYCQITDSGLSHLGRLSALQSLNLSYCEQITNSGLVYVRQLSALQSLELSGCKQITDSGWAHVGRLSTLKSLALSRCTQITDSGWAHVGRLSTLKSLDLSYCMWITDSGLAHVAQLSALQSLELSGCKQITDSGLSHLERLSALQSLSLYGSTQITSAAKDKLRSQGVQV